MKKFGGLLILTLLMISCSKDKVGSGLSLKVTRISGNYLPLPSTNQEYVLYVTLDYSAPDGDLATLPITVQKISSSASMCLDPNLPSPSIIDSSGVYFTFPLDLPATADQQGEITLKLTEREFARNKCAVIDTTEQAVFRFWFHDRGGNVSDTATTETITIEKPR